MSKNLRTSEVQTLEQYRVAFENTASQPQISATMAEYGYDSATMAIGKALYDETRLSFDSNKKETDEEAAAYALFTSKEDQLAKIYAEHRKKAKVVFLNDTVTADKLEISGSLPQAYVKWLQTVKNFYILALADNDIQTQLSRLKITPDGLT